MHSPTDIALQLVDGIVRAGEIAVVVKAGINYCCLIIFQLYILHSFHFDVSETVKGHVRFKPVCLTTENVGASCLGRTKVASVEIPVFIQNFGMCDGYFLPFLSF